MLNGGLWRVRFSGARKLLILERETGFEPATSSLGSWQILPSRRPIYMFSISYSSTKLRRSAAIDGVLMGYPAF
jgi:hypothetical protein